MVVNLSLFRTSLSQMSLVWAITDPPEVIDSYNVYRARESTDAFALIANVFVAYYADLAPHAYFGQAVYYKIGVVSNGVESFSDTVQFFDELPTSDLKSIKKIYSEVERRLHLLLSRRFQYVTIYKRKTCGPRCRCWKPDLGSSPRDCKVCYGVGFEGGYVRIPDVKMKIRSVEEKLHVTRMGLVLDERPVAWLGAIPYIAAGDIIVCRDFTHFSIGDPVKRWPSPNFVRQECVLQFIEPSLIEYKLKY